MAYIKSHSNYVLKKEHQRIADGTIWERDITTIGGLNQFSKGQTPIYKSGNFIITVRDDGKVANQYNKTKWRENYSGNIWTLEDVSGMTSEFEDQNDIKIVLKQDYYDFCDFAYYGSLSEMFRASINDVLTRFPGELYGTEEHAYYTSGKTVDLESVKTRVPLGKIKATVKGEEGDDVENITYAELISEYGEQNILDIEELQCYIDNPFAIDLHSVKKPMDGKAIKFFADDGYKNYEIVNGTSESGTPISTWTSVLHYYDTNNHTEEGYTYEDGYRVACVGEKAATVTISESGTNKTYNIEAWIGDNNGIIYLFSDEEMKDIHIRPKESFIVEFYNNCDNFEKIILDRKTTPKYKATFSVIKGDAYGYYREMEDFIFPTSYGGYNIDASSFGFNDYTARLAEIGAYYDELFTDNLYRSMTHEAIKNFDWSYTREYLKGDEDDFIRGGQKVQKALRVFAREFDELLSYINNIKNVNRVTYDGRSNLPDYFLIDEAENKGWDVKLVYPYDLTEYSKDGNKVENYTEEYQLKGLPIRQFSQDTSHTVNPYTKKNITREPSNGYFITCNNVDGSYSPCYYNGYYKYVEATAATQVVDGKVVNRIKTYSDEKEYTYMDINNEFMRRLVINSNHIFRHKGTQEGIEMLLAMFGLKSKRWVERQAESCTNTADTVCLTVAEEESQSSDEGLDMNTCIENESYDGRYDYEIVEYTSFAERIEDMWDAVHQMYRIDWINSTKTIVYDYRLTSKYTTYGAQGNNYVSYQGLPVSWRYAEENEGKEEFLSDEEKEKNEKDGKVGQYIKVGSMYDDEPKATNNEENDAFKNANDGYQPVKRRFLYPNFDKYEQLDGDPYFQMDGGWLSKTVQNNGKRYNFQFDVDDNIAWIDYVLNGRVDGEGNVIDNKPLFKETVRNIRRVNNINELLKTPSSILKNGSIYYVSNIDKDVAIVDNSVYDINYEYFEVEEGKGTIKRYISLIKNDAYIKIGDDMFFDGEITVYDKNFNEVTYNLSSKESGYEVKAYIRDDAELEAIAEEGEENSEKKPQFICKSHGDYYTIDSFMVFNAKGEEGDTNYFIIDDTYYSNRMASKGNKNGWRRLKETDAEYIKINTITNYYEGNNAHNGNMVYDNGHEYFTYFNRLFKHAFDNELFDERCYEAFYYDAENEINKYGFDGLIYGNELVKQYQCYINEDPKIHYFGNYYTRKETYVLIKDYIYDGRTLRSGTEITFFRDQVYVDDVLILPSDNEIFIELVKDKGYVRKCKIKITPQSKKVYGKDYVLGQDDMITNNIYPYTQDKVTDQIVNNKRMTIKFFLHNEWHSKKGQCELKYLDDIVMNYLAQMIPSSAIVDIKYIYIGSND